MAGPSSNLGRAKVTLEADPAPLRAGLTQAEQQTKVSVGLIARMWNAVSGAINSAASSLRIFNLEQARTTAKARGVFGGLADEVRAANIHLGQTSGAMFSLYTRLLAIGAAVAVPFRAGNRIGQVLTGLDKNMRAVESATTDALSKLDAYRDRLAEIQQIELKRSARFGPFGDLYTGIANTAFRVGSGEATEKERLQERVRQLREVVARELRKERLVSKALLDETTIKGLEAKVSDIARMFGGQLGKHITLELDAALNRMRAELDQMRREQVGDFRVGAEPTPLPTLQAHAAIRQRGGY
jgi:hypothetical protein